MPKRLTVYRPTVLSLQFVVGNCQKTTVSTNWNCFAYCAFLDGQKVNSESNTRVLKRIAVCLNAANKKKNGDDVEPGVRLITQCRMQKVSCISILSRCFRHRLLVNRQTILYLLQLFCGWFLKITLTDILRNEHVIFKCSPVLLILSWPINMVSMQQGSLLKEISPQLYSIQVEPSFLACTTILMSVKQFCTNTIIIHKLYKIYFLLN